MRHTPAHTPQTLEWSFADRLRKVRRDIAKAGQAEFAQALDVNLKAYSAWESGKNTPRELVAVAKRIELVTGVPATWMLGISEEVVQVPARTGTDRTVSTAVNGCYPRTNPRVVIPFPQAGSPRRGYRRNWRRTEKVRRTRTRGPLAQSNADHSFAAVNG